MSALLLLSIALCLAAIIGSMVLWVRSGETRVGLLGALFVMFAIHFGSRLWTHWGEPLHYGADALGAFAGACASALGILVVVAVWRTLGERDRIEKLHWDSMEAVRMMNELANQPLAFEDKISKLLDIGTSRYGLEIGMVSRIQQQRFEVIAIHAPDDVPIVDGTSFALDETFCVNTLESKRPIGVEHLADSSWNGRQKRAAFGYEAYLGSVVRVAGRPFGTLSFASRDPRRERFTATDKDLVQLMAQWLGVEIERQEGGPAYIEPPRPQARNDPSTQDDRLTTAAPTPPVTEPPRLAMPRAPGIVDPNQILLRAEAELRALAGPGIALELKLDAALGFASVQRVPVDAVVRRLVRQACDAMPDGGQLTIETANLEFCGGQPGIVPAMAPDRYVTIQVRDNGSEPDADALSAMYDAGPGDEDETDGESLLSLSSVYRMLQVCGGDLSVDVEPGLGTTYTVYLPRDNDSGVADRDALASRALAASPPPT